MLVMPCNWVVIWLNCSNAKNCDCCFWEMLFYQRTSFIRLDMTIAFVREAYCPNLFPMWRKLVESDKCTSYPCGLMCSNKLDKIYYSWSKTYFQSTYEARRCRIMWFPWTDEASIPIGPQEWITLSAQQKASYDQFLQKQREPRSLGINHTCFDHHTNHIPFENIALQWLSIISCWAFVKTESTIFPINITA